jgi:hypothetical protein
MSWIEPLSWILRSSSSSLYNPRSQRLLEVAAGVEHALALDGVLGVGQGKQRLATTRAVGQHGGGAGGGDGGAGAVARADLAGLVVDRALEGREYAAHASSSTTRCPTLLDEFHHLLGHVSAFLGVVADSHLQQRVGKAHDAQPNAADRPGGARTCSIGYSFMSSTSSRKRVPCAPSCAGGPSRSRCRQRPRTCSG